MAYIKNHPSIGYEVSYPRKGKVINGTVIAVRRATGFLWDRDTGKISSSKFIELKLQPIDGSKAFWTGAVVDASEEPAQGLRQGKA